MYRIRTAAGSEATYNSLEEFTAAVRRGLVVPEDEIFHTRAGRWLDVKSHPHYRNAIEGGVVPTPAAPSAPPTPAQTQARPILSHATAPHAPVAPAPAPRPAPAHAHAQPQSPPQARAQVFERPVKSKELTFVDTGVAPTVGKPNAPVQLATPPAPPAPAPQRTELRPAAKPAPIVKNAGSDLDFLIMDGGIESPVRTSAGHKTIPEEFGLLFDATAVEPQAPPAPTTGKNAAVGPKSGKQQAIQLPAEHIAPAPAAAAALPAVQAEPAPQLDHQEHPAPAADAAPATSWATGSRTNYLGGGIALVVIAVGLLAWKPWKSGGSPESIPSQAASQNAPSYDPNPSSLVTPASATTPPIGTLAGAGAALPAGTKPTTAAPAAKPTDPATATVDSGKKGDDIVIAARPDFGGGGIPVSGDISIGTEVASKAAGTAVAPSELVRRLYAAQKDAQLDLNGRLVSLGFRGVINPARVGTPALVAAARSAWSGGVEAIRTYRSRIARLEKAYEDSVLTSQRAQRWPGGEMSAWASRQSLSEPSDASQLSDLMFTQVSEGLELLASTDYTIKGDRISFKDPSTATRYTSIRGWVEQRMATWAATPESARPYSISATLRALGDGFPSVE